MPACGATTEPSMVHGCRALRTQRRARRPHSSWSARAGAARAVCAAQTRQRRPQLAVASRPDPRTWRGAALVAGVASGVRRRQCAMTLADYFRSLPLIARERHFNDPGCTGALRRHAAGCSTCCAWSAPAPPGRVRSGGRVAAADAEARVARRGARAAQLDLVLVTASPQMGACTVQLMPGNCRWSRCATASRRAAAARWQRRLTRSAPTRRRRWRPTARTRPAKLGGLPALRALAADGDPATSL